MKKILLSFTLISSLCCFTAAADLSELLPLLQAKHHTPAQSQQVLTLFTTSKQASIIFAAGASLVRLPPALSQEPKLYNIFLKDSRPLKKVFAAVILTAMGTQHQELSPLLQQACASQDAAVRAYAASAYTILNPQDKQYADDIINLYIYDAAFAQRAMNLLAPKEKKVFHYLKAATEADQAQVRAAAATWLGDLQTQKAAALLLNMAKKEVNTEVSTALAIALAKNRSWTLETLVKRMNTHYTAQPATTYSLALGFMPGYAIEPIRKGLQSPNINTRINAARAAAYMAGVLASPDASLYSTDKDFDINLLKGLIAQLSSLAKRDEDSVKVYADNALTQIAKLK